MYKRETNSLIKHMDFVLIDLFLYQICLMAAFWIRHGIINPYHNSMYLQYALLMIPVQIVVSFFGETYKDVLRRGYLAELKKTVKQNCYVCAIMLILMFFNQKAGNFSRITLLLTWAFSIVGCYLIRCLWKNIVRDYLMNTKKYRNVVLVTTENQVFGLLGKMKERLYRDFRITGIVLTDINKMGRNIGDVTIIGNRENVIRQLSKMVVDEVFIALPINDSFTTELWEACDQMGITSHLNLFQVNTSMENMMMESFCGCPVLTNAMRTATSRQLFLKRAMDILAGVIGCAITGIAMIFVTPIIKIQSPGPIFFKQKRVGRNGRIFAIYKFRSMYIDAEERKAELMQENEMQGLMFKMKNDPRIFPFGRFMRKFSIDEFPQFLNILKGDMSLVGTRPPTVDEYEQYNLNHKKRLSTKPGLTGNWQVSGRSDITDFEEVVRMDSEYISEWRLSLDLKIIMKTIYVVFGKKGAA